MVLGCVSAKWRAVLFCTKSYYPLVGVTSPIPLNKLIAWLRNSYESLYFAVGIFFRNEKRREPISLKPTDSLLELSSDIVFSDTFLLLLFIASLLSKLIHTDGCKLFTFCLGDIKGTHRLKCCKIDLHLFLYSFAIFTKNDFAGLI